MYFEIIILAFVCFLLRYWPRIQMKTPTSSDTHFHLFFANEIAANSGNIPTKFDRIVIPHRADYPFFYHWIISKFSYSNRLLIENVTSPICDTLIMLSIPFISSQTPFQLTEGQIITACGLYSFYPALFRGSSGPRVFSGCPRVFAQLIYLTHLTLFIEFTQDSNTWALILSLISGSLIIVTAKFGTQVLLFFLPFIAWTAPIYLIVCTGSFVISYFFWRRNFKAVLRGQINHSIFYYKFLQKDFLWPARVSVISYLKKSFFTLKRSIKEFNPKPFIRHVFSIRNPCNTIIFVFPFHLIIFLLYINSFIHSETWSQLIFASLALFLLTSLKWFSFIGEAERYLEYSLVPTIILISSNLTPGPLLSLILGTCSLLCLWMGYDYFLNNRQRSIDLRNFSSALNEVQSTDVIWPIGSFHHTALCFTNSKVITFGANLDSEIIGLDTYKLIYENAPYPSREWRIIMSKYNPKWILTDVDYLEHYIERILPKEDREPFLENFKESIRFPSGLLLLKKC